MSLVTVTVWFLVLTTQAGDAPLNVAFSKARDCLAAQELLIQQGHPVRCVSGDFILQGHSL